MAGAEINLRELLDLRVADSNDALDSFVCHCLLEAGIWDSSRASDGVCELRIVENEPHCVSVVGRIFHIDQSLHVFWLDIRQTSSTERIAWTLHFEVLGDSARRERNALLLHDRAEDSNWCFVVKGNAEVREDRLRVTTVISGHRSEPAIH